MNITGIQRYTSYDLKQKLSKQRAQKVDIVISGEEKKDTYESTNPEDRKKLLESVKKKIKSGYYNSDEVAEDLSQSFAKALKTYL